MKRLIICGLLLLAAGCTRTESAPPQEAQPAALQIGPESVATVAMDEIRTGPLITGELAPETEAAVRAKIGGSVTQTSFDEGRAVTRGAVLARIEARDLEDAAAAAAVAVTSADNALAIARSELQRTEALVKGGALAQRDVENARNTVANAEAQLAAARARVSSARAQLSDTIVRAPIAGVVSDKAVNTGDVVSPGTLLYAIIDPSSMRLEASVPADQIGSLRPGITVVFTVRGYEGQSFTGRIERISPAADPATRQVPIFVSIPNAAGRLIAGLYAEGRVESQVLRGLLVPANAVDMSAGSPAVTRVRDGKAERVVVTLGIRDRESERLEVLSGLSEGDTLLVGAARGVTPGTPVTVGPPPAGAARQGS